MSHPSLALSCVASRGQQSCSGLLYRHSKETAAYHTHAVPVETFTSSRFRQTDAAVPVVGHVDQYPKNNMYGQQ